MIAFKTYQILSFILDLINQHQKSIKLYSCSKSKEKKIIISGFRFQNLDLSFLLFLCGKQVFQRRTRIMLHLHRVLTGITNMALKDD